MAYGKIPARSYRVDSVLKDFNQPLLLSPMARSVIRGAKYDSRAETTLQSGHCDRRRDLLMTCQAPCRWCCFGGCLTSAGFDLCDRCKKMESDKTLKEDPYLHPGDTVFRSEEQAISKIKPWLPSYNTGFLHSG